MEVYTQLYANCDKILDLLGANQHHRMMESDIYGYADDQQRPGMRAALMHLCQYGMIKADPHPYYILLGPGSTLQATGGYKKQFELENIDEKLKDSMEAFALESAKSVIDTNKSIQGLNSKTGTFYDKQTDFNKIQKWLTIAIFTVTAVQVWIAGCNYLFPISSDKGTHIDTATHNTQLRQIEARIQSQTNRFDTFEKIVKDTLKLK